MAGGSSVTLRKEVWLPYGTEQDRVVIWFLDLANPGSEPVDVQLRVDSVWPPIIEDEGLRRAEPQQQEKRVHCRFDDGIVVVQTIDPASRRWDEVRVLGMLGPHAAIPAGYTFAQPGTTRLTYQVPLAPATNRRLTLGLLTTPQGEAEARRMWHTLPDPSELYERTLDAFEERLSRVRVLTPSPVINRGVDWAKVNILRTQTRYPAGCAFTNDPPQDILVIRDAAWFIFGNDFFTPEFSREMIDLIVREGVEPHGKFTEFIRVAEDPPSRDDYGLNINDDTPLFLLALHHHAAVTRDEAFVRRVYPVVRRAAQYILSQTVDDLVVCTARSTNVHGIASWRNIIPSYNLSGAVTELNAECYAALQVAAEMAERLGHAADAARWRDGAARIRAAMNERLVSRATGLYLLALTQQGEPLESLSADMVFPVLFGAASGEVRRKVVERLLQPAFWTSYGARTVPDDQVEYDPDAGYQLLGGVWPNLTAWIAYAVRHDVPGRVAQALELVYRISEADVPAALGHVVPGQFPERLHGETGVSRGMVLSPWMPPTYLWLTVSGLLGVQPSLSGLAVEPAASPGWSWMAARDLSFASGSGSIVWWKGTVAYQPARGELRQGPGLSPGGGRRRRPARTGHRPASGPCPRRPGRAGRP
ncbi:MAG: hypothetical protein IMX02_12820 [Limnochordaceae bacterium]|nr:hypothetical protein [Limnochordaceae bacterium]